MWVNKTNLIGDQFEDGLNLQAWRIPLWAKMLPIGKNGESSLNLQAWRIPLWADKIEALLKAYTRSQPPSLENPFVGDKISFTLKYT